ncbi:MAG TPA: NAD(P)-dependent oxidoreductase [Chitinophagales bacterium]|nr:NAD(P)-dependent oxidoreductase [Chitinophagales bacterium]
MIKKDAVNLNDWPPDHWIHYEFPNVECIIACAAMIGGISYFHKHAYDLLATNERILASTFDLAIKLHKEYNLKRVVVLSSSMVFESTEKYPTPEDEVKKCPPPLSTYGFQKLACEYFAKGAWEQYGVPYTIIRPFNCVGVGEEKALGSEEITSGNVSLMLSHVLPDLINKIMKGQDPLHILGEGNQIRCYTNGLDIARGIVMAMESDKAINEDFNISTPVATSVLELAKLVWEKLSPDKPFNFVSDQAYEYDVQKRIPDVSKAEKLLGFKSEISLDESIDEVIGYMKDHNND